MARGTTRPRERHWRDLIDLWKRSGTSVAEFCRRRSISSGTFSWWKHELRRRDGMRPSSNGARPRLVPVRVVDRQGSPSAPAVVELSLRDGRSVRIHATLDPVGMARLVRALDGAAC